MLDDGVAVGGGLYGGRGGGGVRWCSSLRRCINNEKVLSYNFNHNIVSTRLEN